MINGDKASERRARSRRLARKAADLADEGRLGAAKAHARLARTCAMAAGSFRDHDKADRLLALIEEAE